MPDWACEILAPGSVRDDRLEKLRIYAAHGVSWTWIVDPDARSIERFESVDRLLRQALVAQEGENVSLPPFDLPIAIDALRGATAARGRERVISRTHDSDPGAVRGSMRRTHRLFAMVAGLVLGACGTSQVGETASSEESATAPTQESTARSAPTDELPCLPIVHGCGCSYDCAQALERSPDGSFRVERTGDQLDRATIGRLCLPDGRCREAFEDGTPCGGECVPTDAHFGCHREGDRCVP